MANRFGKPQQTIGASINSGYVNTGEFNNNTGGQSVYTSFSGIIVDTMIYSGGGRFKSVEVISNINSGQSTVFYDAHVVTSGGPFSTSGHRILGIIPPVWVVGASGVINEFAKPGNRQVKDAPFFSGLAVAVISSGAPSFTAQYTPDTSGFGLPSQQ